MPSSVPVATLQLTDAPWRGDHQLHDVMRVIAGPENDETIRIVGGAVRDAVLQRPVTDIDLATTATPDRVVARAAAAGFRPVPTGITHGTVTVVAAGRPFEITTLREDVVTDGRHATVTFGRDWSRDAARRDFTLNALYADFDGLVTDHVGGLADCAARRIRFIGAPEARIREDYLRILRFFRFNAVIDVAIFDPAALAAIDALQAGIDRLSGERIGQEMLKLVVAQGAVAALEVMSGHGLLARALTLPAPDVAACASLKHHLAALGPIDAPMPKAPATLLLAALAGSVDAALIVARRLRLSNAARDGMVEALQARDRLATQPSDAALAGLAWRWGSDPLVDGVLLSPGATPDLLRRIALIRAARPQHLPITGRDLLAAGLPPGPEIGTTLERLTDLWIDSDFSLTRAELLARIN